MKTKLIFYCYLLILLPINGFSTHILGGEMYYEYLGNNDYKITIKVYRDCEVNTNPYEDPAEVNVFDMSSGNPVNSPEFFTAPLTEDLTLTSINSCDSAPTTACYRLLIYEKIVNLPPVSGGYLISYTRCCRTSAITNILGAINTGITLTSTIPGSTSGNANNSSPRIAGEPEIYLCVNKPLEFDLSAYDVDGDSLSYELVNPLTGDYNLNSPPPFGDITFSSGYTYLNPLGGSSSVSLNANTGLLNMSPQQAGMFQFGMKVNEYRNGVFIGSTRRDFFFIVRVCPSFNFFAEIREQVDLNDFVSYCQGLDINFINLSDFGSNYIWDFGIANSDSDTSSMINPSFTYPQSGTYIVSLIADPGLQCSDTAEVTFIVYETPDLEIVSDSFQCITNNSFDFSVVGTPNTSTSYLWDFGLGSSPLNSSDSIVFGVNYSTAGNQPVVLYLQDPYCADTLYDTITIYGQNQLNLSFTKIDEIACLPYQVQFSNLSTGTGNTQYLWDFGNGNSSTSMSPVTIFTVTGNYDITLMVISDSGCVDTASITYFDYVNVFPSPTAGIDVDRNFASPYDPIIEFYNLSIDYTSFEFHVEGIVSTADPYSHTFIQSGDHYPYIVAANDFGCTDTASIHVKLSAEETIFIPSAFTPNGDGKNDFFKLNLFDLLEFEFIILNRQGQIIFKTNDADTSWDGKYNNKSVQDGVYIYQLKYTNLEKLPKYKRGTITILK